MKVYERKIGGYTVRQQLSDESAEALGLKAPVKRVEQVETAVVVPENKTERQSGGRRIGKRS